MATTTTASVAVFESERTGETAWGLAGGSLAWRADGRPVRLECGGWELVDEVELEDVEPSAARDEVERRIEAARSTKRETVDEMLAILRAAPIGRRVRVDALSGGWGSFVHLGGGALAAAFYKRGGRVLWTLPVTERDARALLSGEAAITYCGQRGSVVRKGA